MENKKKKFRCNGHTDNCLCPLDVSDCFDIYQLIEKRSCDYYFWKCSAFLQVKLGMVLQTL